MITATGDRTSLHLSLNDTPCTVLKNRPQTFKFGPEEFHIAKEGFFNPDWQLWAEDALLASHKGRTFSYAGGVWKLKCTNVWFEIEYSLYQDKNAVGHIRSKRHWLSHLSAAPSLDFKEIFVDLPEEFPAIVQLFLIWLACCLWATRDGISDGD